MVRPCQWRCRLCPATGTSRTPVDAFWWHYRNTHQTTWAPVGVKWGDRPSTATVIPAITSIWHGTGKP